MSTEESIFAQCLELPADQRDRFLEECCGDDESLKSRIRELLGAHERTNSFIDQVVTTQADDQLVGKEIGKFKLLQKIGEGGFGVVYMAEQREPIVRKVALKIVKPGMDSNSVIGRFEAERQALAILDHPNIAKVFDGGSTNQGSNSGIVTAERPYFAMELVNGIPITEYCDQNHLPTSERLKLFVDVCKAVQHAHQKGIIHRDIKPSNVMVTLHDGQPVVKVIDFGIAKALNQRLTERTMFTEYGQMIGTPQYMSPEQAEMSGLDVDTRSDIYSLAVLLYELLTGTTPLEANSIREAGFQKMQDLICHSEPPKPSQRVSTCGERLTAIAKHRNVSPDRLSREIRGDLDWIVMKGLEKDRSRRYESPEQFAQDIQRAMRHEPVIAGPPSFLYRLQKWILRNPTTSVATVAVLLILVVSTVFLVQRQNSLIARRIKDSESLTRVVNESSRLLGIASSSTFDSTAWVEAEASKKRIIDLIQSSSADATSRERADRLLDEFKIAEFDRDFSSRLEDILIRRATMMDLDSWAEMEKELKGILKLWDLDVETLAPDEVAKRVVNHRAKVRITDAIELWIGTRGQMAMMGGPKLNKQIMQPWADAMYAMDDDPLRQGIRRIIYQDIPPTRENLEKLISENDIESASPRTLAWLSSALAIGRMSDRANELIIVALRKHPNDLMLNFDHAFGLASQSKWNEAIRYYMRCLALRPRNAGCWMGLGKAYRENGENKNSVDALAYSAELNPKVATTWIELAKSNLLVENLDACIESAKKGIALNSDLLVGWKIIGEAEMKREQYKKALEAFAECKRDPRSARSSPDVADLVAICEKKLQQSTKQEKQD